MAKLKAPFDFHGKLGELSAYTMQGHDGIILRRLTGPSKEDIKNKPAFDITRRHNREFGGRSNMVKWIRQVLLPLRAVYDYNNSGALNSALVPVQQMDTTSEFGQRHVLLSAAPHLLKGFGFSRKFPFDNCVRSPLACSLDRASLSASISVPQLLPGHTFVPPGTAPYYCVKLVLAMVPDLFYGVPAYRPKEGFEPLTAVSVQSEWYSVQQPVPAQKFHLQLPDEAPSDDFSLMVAAAIMMGTAGASGEIEVVRHTGCGKIVEMA